MPRKKTATSRKPAARKPSRTPGEVAADITQSAATPPQSSVSDADILAAKDRANVEQIEAAARAYEATLGPAVSPTARPEVVRTGLVAAREPSTDPASGVSQAFPDLLRQVFVPPAPLEKSSPSERVFNSKYERHAMQVTCPAPTYDPLYGKRTDHKAIVIKFEPNARGFGEFRTTDPFLITFIEGGIGDDGKRIPPCMGWQHLVWDAEDRQKAEAQVFVQNIKAMIASNPEVVDALRPVTTDEDFAVFLAIAKKQKAADAAAMRES